MQLVDMATAHLNNIQNAISDLQKQKANIDAEISKLSQYYEEGLQEVKKHSDGVSE